MNNDWGLAQCFLLLFALLISSLMLLLLWYWNGAQGKYTFEARKYYAHNGRPKLPQEQKWLCETMARQPFGIIHFRLWLKIQSSDRLPISEGIQTIDSEHSESFVVSFISFHPSNCVWMFRCVYIYVVEFRCEYNRRRKDASHAQSTIGFEMGFQICYNILKEEKAFVNKSWKYRFWFWFFF